jgi:membrane protease YdiL (CAAX protease family)
MGLARRGWLADARWGALAALIVYPLIALGVGTVVVIVLQVIFGSPVKTPPQIDTEALSVVGQTVAVVYGVIIAPIAEEFFFRGILFRSIADRRGFWLGAIVSGAVFGFVHLPWGEPLRDALVLPITLAVAGVAFAWIYERRRRLIASIAAHMAFNVIGLVLLLVLPDVGV